VLALTNPKDWVLDPFLGVGTTIAAAIRHKRRGVGAEIMSDYVDIAKKRIQSAAQGSLKVRPMHKPVYDPKDAGSNLTKAPWLDFDRDERQLVLLEKPAKYGTR
jgi:adenine-specific DNA-methyltransferase